MGNTHIESHTKERLLAYMRDNTIPTPSRAVDALLAREDLLRVTETLVDSLKLAVSTLKDENERLKAAQLDTQRSRQHVDYTPTTMRADEQGGEKR